MVNLILHRQVYSQFSMYISLMDQLTLGFNRLMVKIVQNDNSGKCVSTALLLSISHLLWLCNMAVHCTQKDSVSHNIAPFVFCLAFFLIGLCTKKDYSNSLAYKICIPIVFYESTIWGMDFQNNKSLPHMQWHYRPKLMIAAFAIVMTEVLSISFGLILLYMCINSTWLYTIQVYKMRIDTLFTSTQYRNSWLGVKLCLMKCAGNNLSKSAASTLSITNPQQFQRRYERKSQFMT